MLKVLEKVGELFVAENQIIISEVDSEELCNKITALQKKKRITSQQSDQSLYPWNMGGQDRRV